MSDDQSQPERETEPIEDPAPMATIATEVVEQPRPKKRPKPAPPRERSALDGELDQARDAVFAATAAWLEVTWEQPILRAMSANAGTALENADAFPVLRTALSELQSHARETAESALAPLLDHDAQMRDQALISSVDGVALQLAGLIGVPLRDAGLDPLSGGLERVQDGYRLKAMTEHEQITAAVREYCGVNASLAAERAELVERDRENARVEVERLWQATAVTPATTAGAAAAADEDLSTPT